MMGDAPTAPLAVRAESLAKTFTTRAGTLEVLRDVSLTLETGEAVVITGPSGSGKSTLLNILGTLEPPTGGRVEIAARDPQSLSPAELARFRREHVGFVFQDQHLLPQCSVLENVLVPTLPERSQRHVAVRAEALLGLVGLADRLDHRPAELSGGERQRVALARAMINQPTLLLADEPTGNLDRAAADVVAALLGELYREGRVALVVVTHSMVLAERFDRAYALVDGVLTSR